MGDTTIDFVTSTDHFTKKLSDSGLLTPEEIMETAGSLAAGTTAVDVMALAERLVNAGKLTSFQAKAVLEQRSDELRIGNYDVLERLGAGAMGVVYKARHRRMKRIVAIKVLAKSIAKPSFVQRFQREVETLAQLTHPNVIMAFDADECEAGHFLVMEFVNGRDLSTIIEETGRMSLAHAVEAIDQSARGLEYAHAKSIIHRDIKPANIMWDSSGVVKVADLGLARLITGDEAIDSNSLTQAGSMVGTVDYMAPEQAADSSAIDERADIYSLGCTFYYLLTAQAPFHGNSVMAVLLKHRDAPIPKVRDIRPDVPEAVESLIQSMLAKTPETRIPSMSAVLKALAPIKASLEQGGANAVPSELLTADMTVVLAEASRAQASIVRSYLQNLGVVNIHTTTSGASAIELAKQHKAHAMVCSMQLSDMTGMQLVQSIRADQTFADLGFVLAASGADAADIASLRALPHTAQMSKPFDAPKLLAAFSEAMGRNLVTRS